MATAEMICPNFPQLSPLRTPQGAETPVLSVSPIAGDHTALRELVSGMPCQIDIATTCRYAFWWLSHTPASIIICERDLPDGTWRDVLNHVGAGAGKPFLIVTSRLADEALWAEVLNLGGFDVIAKPFHPREVRHVLETACLRNVRNTAASHAAASAGR